MKKFYVALQTLLLAGSVCVHAQNLYSINNTWLNLETFKNSDTAATYETDFKKSGKYACRFSMPMALSDAPKTVVFKDKTYRIVDDGHIGIVSSTSTHEVVLANNTGENEYDPVPGNNFLFVVSDGVVNVQRFDDKIGYRITKYDEYGHVRLKQAFPHTRSIEKDGNEFKQPYLAYFMHTDRYLVFTSPTSHDIHKTIVVDLKDGKANPIESTVCGAIRAGDDKGIVGYIIPDDRTKSINVTMAAGKWSLKENNTGKVLGETILNDTVLVMARYYKATAGVSLAAFHAKTGKLLWVADIKKPTAAQNKVFLSMYKNQVLMEGSDVKGNYLQAFDIATGKRTYSSI